MADEAYPPGKKPSDTRANVVDTPTSIAYLLFLRHCDSDTQTHNQDPEVQRRMWPEWGESREEATDVFWTSSRTTEMKKPQDGSQVGESIVGYLYNK